MSHPTVGVAHFEPSVSDFLTGCAPEECGITGYYDEYIYVRTSAKK